MATMRAARSSPLPKAVLVVAPRKVSPPYTTARSRAATPVEPATWGRCSFQVFRPDWTMES